MVIGGTVAGEVWRFHDSNATVTHAAEIAVDGYDGRVRFYEAATLRDLATALADLLDTAHKEAQ